MLFDHLDISSLKKCLFRSSAHFFDWVVCFFDLELHELVPYWEINPLSVILFSNLFSHSVSCLFISFMIFFAVKKPLTLIRSHFFFLLLVLFSLLLGVPVCSVTQS